MKIEKDLNAINKNEFTAIFGSVFEKSEWIATETFRHKPFKNYQDLIDKMIKIYESCSIDQIINILNLHPKLAIEKKLTSFSSKEQTGAKLDECSQAELVEFDKLNFGSKVELIVLIYSRDGDLLHSSTQEIGISNE